MTRSQKFRCSGLERVILAGALCLVAVCAFAEEDPPGVAPFTGLPLPLTLTQKFVLTNNLLFASPENQLQNVEIVYAYEPDDDLLTIFDKYKIGQSQPCQKCFEILEVNDPKGRQALWQMESSYKAMKHNFFLGDILDDIVSDNKQKRHLDTVHENRYFAISEDCYINVLPAISDKTDSNFIKENAKKFFIFQTQNSWASGSPTTQLQPSETPS